MDPHSTNPTIALSFFDSEHASTTRAWSGEWSEFADFLQMDPRRTACACHASLPAAPCREKHGAAVSAAVYPEHGTRGKRWALGANVLALDFDHVSESDFDRLRESLKPFDFIAHSSHSDRTNDRAIRVYVRFSAFVPAGQFAAARAEFVALLAVAPDPRAADLPRLMFLPSRPAGASYLFLRGHGAPFTPTFDKIPVPAVDSRSLPATPSDDRPASAEVVAAAREYLRATGPAIQGQGGDAHTYEVACRVAHDYALSEAQALEVLGEWDAANRPPWGADLRDKIHNARTYATGTRGLLAAGVEVGAMLRSRAAAEAPRVVEVPDDRVSELLSDVAARPRAPVVVTPTGFPELDRRLGGGLWSGRLHAIAGPPGDGKSAFAAAVAANVEPHRPVLLASTELESDELAARFASPLIGVPWSLVIRGHSPIGAVLDGKRIRVIGCDRLPRQTDQTLDTIATEACAMADVYGVMPLVIVDYMQQITRGGGGEDNVRHRVGDVASRLRQMSQVLATPVLTVLSVSRQYYGHAKQDTTRNSDDPTIYLAAAKESGDVDYDCAVILFLDVVRSTDGESGPRPARVAVAKCRHGSTGFVGARFDGTLGTWTEDSTALADLTNARSGTASASEVGKQARGWIEKIRAWAEKETYFTERELDRMKDEGDPEGKRRAIPRAVLAALTDRRRDEYLEVVEVLRWEGGKRQARDVLLPKGWAK